MLYRTGAIKVAQFNGITEIYSRPTRDAMVTKWLFLNRNLAVAQLCKIWPWLLYQTLFHGHVAYI